VSSTLNRFYDRIRHPSAASFASQQRTAPGFQHLRGHKYCLLVTHKRSGEAVPTPVWFGLAEENLYVRTDADAAKVKRILNHPQVRVGPCSARGKPLGPPAEGHARILDQPGDLDLAEAALNANYGLGRKLYEKTSDAARVNAVYLEIRPLSGRD
jgi:PPOX class probable F420-dependent enzyme